MKINSKAWCLWFWFKINEIGSTENLSDRKQKEDNAYSSWKEIYYGILQGLILGPLIFNNFLRDLFYFLDGVTVASYAANTNP